MSTVLNSRAAGQYLNADPKTIKRIVPTELYVQGATGRLDPLWFRWQLDDWADLVRESVRRGQVPAELRERIEARRQALTADE